MNQAIWETYAEWQNEEALALVRAQREAERAARPFEERVAEFLAGLQALTERTGIAPEETEWTESGDDRIYFAEIRGPGSYVGSPEEGYRWQSDARRDELAKEEAANKRTAKMFAARYGIR